MLQSPRFALTLVSASAAPNPPLVTVVTPSLNQGRYLRQAVDSVLAQDYESIEYLVADGGSTDESLEILRSYGGRLRWVSEPDGGQADAVNKGWGAARGEVLGWLNSDDTYEPGAVRRAVEVLAAHPGIDIVHGDWLEMDEQARLLRGLRSWNVRLDELLLFEAWVGQPTVFLRRRVVERIGYLDDRLHLAMDFDYWLRAMRCCVLLHVPEVWARVRIHPLAKTKVRSRETLGDHLDVLRRVFSDGTLPAALRQLERRSISRAFLAAAVASYDAGQSREARGRLISALRQQPFGIEAAKALALLLAGLLGPAAPAALHRLVANLRPAPRWRSW